MAKKYTLRKSKLSKKDINRHRRALRETLVTGLLDQVRHIKIFKKTFGKKDKDNG